MTDPEWSKRIIRKFHYGSTFWGVALIMAFPFSRQIGDFHLLSTLLKLWAFQLFCPFSGGDSRWSRTLEPAATAVDAAAAGFKDSREEELVFAFGWPRTKLLTMCFMYLRPSCFQETIRSERWKLGELSFNPRSRATPYFFGNPTVVSSRSTSPILQYFKYAQLSPEVWPSTLPWSALPLIPASCSSSNYCQQLYSLMTYPHPPYQ